MQGEAGASRNPLARMLAGEISLVEALRSCVKSLHNKSDLLLLEAALLISVHVLILRKLLLALRRLLPGRPVGARLLSTTPLVGLVALPLISLLIVPMD